ncbi:MAG: glutamine synthetase III [Bdellovibrionales bacterium]|nr:glutamine synthetase III [Bdellovibrionales bacterium]
MKTITERKSPSRQQTYGESEIPPKISDYFGQLTFGLREMREKLPREAYAALLRTLEKGEKLTKETGDQVAQVVKEWAVAKGCTHFCHWFQPMTGLTAEKHDAFISIQYANHSELRVIERFSGGQLIQGEPDASSFPSGGMRSTFEARGYTAWDPTSPIFIAEEEGSSTLCIPTVFFGYHGQALDNKTPLLRSVQSLNREACEFLKLLGDVDVKSVTATLGVEQEYFLIDKSFAALRPDLMMSGRTLLGAAPTRGQQLEDHYFGSIPSRIKAFMVDSEQELYKLGIPVKTRHNEVAPSQYELAPIFENSNIAVDHNTMTMDVLKKVANKHGLMCLLHEKPFAGLNGSGKHCNWAISNDKGENLLEPGTTPHQNLRFLAVCSVVLKAVHSHADALRAAIASPGNDHRLGGNEAPPAIISVFLGSLLSEIFDSIEKGKASKATEGQIIDLGVSQIPRISKDYTDRNRTSPFAFTGNKFEFRAVGSSSNTAVPMSILNAAVADVFAQATARLKKLIADKGNRDEAVMELTRQLATESRFIRFEGNNYSAEWREEALKRKLPVLDRTADALKVLNDKKATEFLVTTKVLSEDEIHARYHIGVERYVKTLLIELYTLNDMVNSYVLPALENQIAHTGAAGAVMSPEFKRSFTASRMAPLEKTYEEILGRLGDLKTALDRVDSLHDEEKKMSVIADDLVPLAKRLREQCDLAEGMVAEEYWTLPKYREMLFANSIA